VTISKKFVCNRRPAVLHFNAHEHRASKKSGQARPCLVFRRTRSGKAVLCREVKFSGIARLIYSPHKPLKCGAVAWMEVTGELELFGVQENEETSCPSTTSR
jgi:hypothetical protein